MTQEEKDALLEEAKRHYPVGTEYNCARDGHINTAERDPEIIDTVDGDIDVGVGYVRYNGKWATIVSTPQPQFEVGKWYKGFKDSDKVAAKFTRLTEGKFFHFDEIIRKSEGYKFVYNGSWELPITITEVPLSEIQQYLPEGHPDRLDGLDVVAAKDEEWEPKIDLWVKCIGDGNTDGFGIDGGWANGLIFKVTSVTKEYRGIRNILWGGKNGCGVFKHNLVPALPHEIPGNEQQKKEACEDCEGTGKGMEMRLYPSGPTEVTVDCKTRNGKGSVTTNQINNSQLNVKHNGTNQKGNIIEVCTTYPEIISGKRRRAEIVEGRGCEVQVRARPKRNPQSINA